MTSVTVDLMPLPQTLIPIQTQLDLQFTPDDYDSEIIQQEQAKLLAEQAEKNRELCQTQPWWTCNTQKTQGACHLNNNSMCVPVGLKSEPKSYFEQWKQVYGPFYRTMEENTPRQRSLSVEPKVNRVNLVPSGANMNNLSQPTLYRFMTPPNTKTTKHFNPKKP